MPESQKKQLDPKMHTAEYILNRTMVNIVGTERCFSAHIEKKNPNAIIGLTGR